MRRVRANERRPTHLEVDRIIPWLEGRALGTRNLQALCTACHRRKGTRSQTGLWRWMTDHGGMWDAEAARFAHHSAVNLNPAWDIARVAARAGHVPAHLSTARVDAREPAAAFDDDLHRQLEEPSQREGLRACS